MDTKELRNCKLSDFDDDDLLDECERRGLNKRIDIVTESQLEELNSLFLSADFNKRNEILKLIKQWEYII